MNFNIGAIIISNKILEDKKNIMWMYRDEPIDLVDSGWRVFSGTEEEDYLNEPSNFKTISTEQLILIDDSLKINLLAPVGSSFERDDRTLEWRPVEMGY